MKYPGLPPCRSDGTAPWDHAGRDIGVARQLLLSEYLLSPSTTLAVKLFEVDRRAARPGAGRWLADAEAHERTDRDRALRCYATAVAAFYLERPDLAEAALRDMDELRKTMSELSGYPTLARARLMRFSGGQPSIAIEAAEQLLEDDLDGAADAHREVAAHLIMTGEIESAEDHANRALDRHAAIGDRYLESLARILLGRVAHEQGRHGMAEEHFRNCESTGLEIGSREIADLASHYVVRSLVLRGVPSRRQADEALNRLDRLLEGWSGFDFSRAEFLIMRSRLHSLQLDFEPARSDLGAYEELMRRYDNKVGLANALKERARLEIGVARALWAASGLVKRIRSSRRLLDSMVLMARSGAMYAEGRLPTAAAKAQADQALLAALLGRTAEAENLLPAVFGSATPGGRALTVAAVELASGDLEAAARSLDDVELGNEPTATLELIALNLARAEVADRRADLEPDGILEHHQRRFATTSALTALRALTPLQSTLRTGSARSRLAEMTDPVVSGVFDRAVRIGDHDAALEANEFRRSSQLAGLLREGAAWALPPRIVSIVEELDRVESEIAELSTRQPMVGRLIDLETDTRSSLGLARSLAERQAALHQRLAEATSVEFAALYDPARPDYAATLSLLPPEARILALQVTEASAGSITRMWRTPTGGGVDRWPLTASRRTAIGLLSTSHLGDVTIGDLGPLGDLIPQPLVDDLASADRPPPILIVPSGPLWGVPYPALPCLGGRPLVELADLLLCPSLTLQALLAERPAPEGGRRVAWIDPDPGFDADREYVRDLGFELIVDPATVRDRLTEGSVQAVLASHGNDALGLAHGLLGPDGSSVYLRASDFVAAGSSPALLVLAACNGAFVPGDQWDEPLGLATAALCMGTGLVVASVGRLGLDQVTSEFLGWLYRELAGPSASWMTVAQVQREWLASGGTSSSVLSWGTVCAMGH